jgi:hypothetical protein
MQKIAPKKYEKAFRLRVERRSFKDIAKATGVSAKTIGRWEKGWVDAAGHAHAGWKDQLRQAWKDRTKASLQYGLILKEERLKAYEELARLAIAKVKESFPEIRAKNAMDVKALISEVRELCRLIGRETGQVVPNPHAVVALKTDVTINDLRERYKAAEVVEVADAPAKEADEDSEDEREEAAEGEGPDGAADEA